MRILGTYACVVASTALGGCAVLRPLVSQAAPKPTHASTAPVSAAQVARPATAVAMAPIPNPPASAGRSAPRRNPADPAARVALANAAARVQPNVSDYANAAQIYEYEDGALYQVYASPGRITDIVLQEGETLSGNGPVAAGDTTRWIIGDTESGSGPGRRVHILVKPTGSKLQTNLVINSNRRTYHLELRATPATYMASVAWRYPAEEAAAAAAAAAADRYALPTVAVDQLNFGYRISGDRAAWRPARVYDDGRQTYIELPATVVQSELPPLFVAGADGKVTDLVNYRVIGKRIVVDRIFTRAELRLGDSRGAKRVRIERKGAGA
ncbi:MAG: P-type conjugative transfer protein TrbG [Phenylobacterium sp.]|nr:P-type conjugative transfer protein TrbG [Phenylobacterium sp.]